VDTNDFQDGSYKPDAYSKAVRAGKRTYFFDVKTTRSNDFYITITESKKVVNDHNDSSFYEKHKVFLYKEDFEKFIHGLNDAITFIKSQRSGFTPTSSKNSTDDEVDFEDLNQTVSN